VRFWVGFWLRAGPFCVRNAMPLTQLSFHKVSPPKLFTKPCFVCIFPETKICILVSGQSSSTFRATQSELGRRFWTSRSFRVISQDSTAKRRFLTTRVAREGPRGSQISPDPGGTAPHPRRVAPTTPTRTETKRKTLKKRLARTLTDRYGAARPRRVPDLCSRGGCVNLQT
jgi:hypothetical protein